MYNKGDKVIILDYNKKPLNPPVVAEIEDVISNDRVRLLLPDHACCLEFTTNFEKIDEELGNKTEWIIPNAQKNEMEPIRVTIRPGGKTYIDDPHEGEEFGYVLSGQITIHVGQQTYRAKKGEAFYFKPTALHYIEAAGKAGASIIWVSTPPSF